MTGCSPAALVLCLMVATSTVQDPEQRTAVDVELVLATDTSVSMTLDERRIQVLSYAQAFRDPAVWAAIRSGGRSRIAVTYVEWSGPEVQRVIVPWTLIDGDASADAFADSIAMTELEIDFNPTALGDAILFAKELIEANSYEGERKIIDISGDGHNNDGMAPELARDAAVQAGITINGLPLLIRASDGGSFPARHDPADNTLAKYYQSAVVGGPGSFEVVVRDIDDLETALRAKLVREIASSAR